MAKKIFISYSHKDDAVVAKLVLKLIEAGFDVCKDDRILRRGELWTEEIAKAIMACDVFILIISAASIQSDFVRREVDQVISYKRRIIPIRLDDTGIPPSMSLQLTGIQSMDYRKEDCFSRLLDALNDPVPTSQPSPSENDSNIPVLHRGPASRKGPDLFHEVDEIEPYFTNVDELRSLFKDLISTPRLTKRILIIHGMAGVGKRSLLLMFASQCRKAKIPVAMVSADSTSVNSALDIMNKWTDDLRLQKCSFSKFQKTRKRYYGIKDEATERWEHIASASKNFVSKSLENLTETALDTKYGPGVGSIGGAFIGTATEEILKYIGNNINKPDQELARDPEGKLTALFLDELKANTKSHPLVLMLDSYEKLRAYDEWIGQVISEPTANILFVVAGQKLNDFKSKSWFSILSNSMTEPLEPMNPQATQELIRRYFQHQIGKPPDPAQAKTIADFARGLPIAVKYSIQLWKYYKVGEFREIKSDVLENVVEYVLKSVPDEIVDLLKASSIARLFTHSMLEATTAKPISKENYSMLRKMDFTSRSPMETNGVEWLRIHPSIRDILCDKFTTEDKKYFSQINGKTISYYSDHLNAIEEGGRKRNRLEEYEQYSREIIYHLIQGDRYTEAIQLGRKIIDEALGNYGRPFAESVVRVFDEFLLDPNSRQWVIFFHWLIAKFSADIDVQKPAAQRLLDVLSDSNLDDRLRVAIITVLGDLPMEVGIKPEERIAMLEGAIAEHHLTDEESASAYLYLGGVHRENAEWKASINDFSKAFSLSTNQDDIFGIIRCSDSLAYTNLLMGDWEEALKWAKTGVDASRLVKGYWLSTALKTLGWVYTYCGELAIGNKYINEALDMAKERKDESEIIRINRRLADIYDRQGKWADSNSLYLQYIKIDESKHRIVSMSSYLALLGTSLLKQGEIEKAEGVFIESLDRIDKHNIQNSFLGLGHIRLFQNSAKEAEEYFEKALSVSVDRPYYLAQASLGLVLANDIGGNYQQVPGLVDSVENLSIQHK